MLVEPLEFHQRQQFRDERIAALREAVRLPDVRPPTDVRITARRGGNGYQLVNLVYQSRPGLYVPANLYLPPGPSRLSSSFTVPTIPTLRANWRTWERYGREPDVQCWFQNGSASASGWKPRLGIAQRMARAPCSASS
jgi:hypothetical protein